MVEYAGEPVFGFVPEIIVDTPVSAPVFGEVLVEDVVVCP